MRMIRHATGRRGAVVPLVALCLVAMLGMVALAIDIGMVAVAKTQAQNAADSAAMVGTRTFNQSSTYNLANVPKNAVTAAVANKIFANSIAGDPSAITNPSADTYISGDVKIEAGGYYYVYNDSDSTKEGFQIAMPPTGKPSTEPYTAVRATITTTSPIFFGAVFGASPFNVRATAISAHRPRDVVIIMDLSGSMRFQSCPGAYLSGSTISPNSGPRNKSLNPETVYPQFGHYSDTTTAALFGNTSYSTGSEGVDPANISTTSNSGPPVIADFMKSGSTLAFARSPDSYATTPGGDDYLKSGGSYVATVNAFLGSTAGNLTWERNATNGSGVGYGSTFNGYTAGPGYWGKTFFIWPPDPRGSDLDPTVAANHANNGAKDWRQRFFFKKNTSTNTLYWLDHNNILINPSGVPTTSNGSTTNYIIKAPNTTTTVTENGASVTYRYCINYAAVFQWLRNQTPTHFPSTMITGRIQYYNAIPDPTGDNNFNNRFWTQSPMTDLNERFWKEYVDFMLGVVGTGANTYSNNNGTNPFTSYIGNGDFYKWGTTAIQVTQRPDNNYRGYITNTGGYAVGATTVKVNSITGSSTPTAGHYMRFGYGSTIYKILSASVSSGVYTITLDSTVEPSLKVAVANSSLVQFYTAVPRYMDYNDNVYRPRHQFWFGPLSFVDWLGNYSIYSYNGTNYLRWPGNVHEAQAWACKVGISSAIDDIKNNHPNDFVGMTFFSSPNFSTSGGGQHNQAVVPLGRSYQNLKDSLWFPPSTVAGTATTITPYDADFNNVPRANGGTAPGMGFMIAYNLFSSSVTNLRTYAQPQPTYRGYAGGLGRSGANRLVIFETDGAPNTRAYDTLGGSGTDSYYKIRMKYPTNVSNSANEFPSNGTYANSEVYDVVKQICALTTASPPGYSTSRKPAKVYSIGYGSMFDPANTSNPSAQSNALTFLQTVQYYGNVATSTSGSNFPDWQRIYGDNTTRQTRMQAAFTKIMQSGVQVSLLE